MNAKQSPVRRILVEKRPGYDTEAKQLLANLRDTLRLYGLEDLHILKQYDVQGLDDETYERAKHTIFSEPTVDIVYDEGLPEAYRLMPKLAVAYLPGQYDQRADSAMQCVQLLTQKERPLVESSTVYVFVGEACADMERIKKYLINPVESHEVPLEKPETLDRKLEPPKDVSTVTGFIALSDDEISGMAADMGLAMSVEDLRFCRDVFRDSYQRDPTLTELRVIDTYWSDHCRHTTFLTKIDSVSFESGPLSMPIAEAYADYLKVRGAVYDGWRDMSLMDMAVIGMKELKRQGKLDDLDESDEINACSIVISAKVKDSASPEFREEPWLIMFKNETHNHPTEIEPFGGAATCLGGAIRDPLSGRSYVYQAMRISGSGDPRVPYDQTLPGKLPTRKITGTAAAGFSSYGNQIGLATGVVHEYYHPGYVAKRLELGVVIGAAPQKNVVRQTPEAGDIVLLVGGRTGRDGCGGATGSSKAHTSDSLETCGAEVQKGNPPTERNIQRLFRDPNVARMIKRCNDFGAGGVSVAIGELAPGLSIDLSAVPKKYEGLDGTELAISESQERMACVVAPGDAAAFTERALAENLECTPVAIVTREPNLRMNWRGRTIVDLTRAFLDTNGVTQRACAFIPAPEPDGNWLRQVPDSIKKATSLPDAWLKNLEDLAVCSQRGLIERFDSSIGASAVLTPFGGKYRATQTQAMVSKLPVEGETLTCTAVAHGFNPGISSWSPFHGAVYAVLEAVAKIAATGCDAARCRLTLQEYFKRLNKEPERWGQPVAALLGAFYAQMRLSLPSIGGKDSMSGSFDELDVPPTLVAIAVGVSDTANIISPEFKAAGHQVCFCESPVDAKTQCPDFEGVRALHSAIHRLIADGRIISCYVVVEGGVAAAVSKMALGNRIGLVIGDAEKTGEWDARKLFAPKIGSFVIELAGGLCRADIESDLPGVEYIGKTQSAAAIIIDGHTLNLHDVQRTWEVPLNGVFPISSYADDNAPWQPYSKRAAKKPAARVAKPRVFIPVFQGTNCEYDSARAFRLEGAEADMLVFRNLTPKDIDDSINEMARLISGSQIVMFPGGFSSGDEPDGSGKFIATALRNPRIEEAIMELLNKRDGLILGICNGFQALLKVGLLPFGEIRETKPDDPTLTYNNIGRHAALMVDTVVSSTLSPWLMFSEVGDVHAVHVSHGEGRFVCSQSLAGLLLQSGQIATQYADGGGHPCSLPPYSPNGALWAIEGISSPDGRIFGKMAHSERMGDRVAINIPGEKDQGLFKAGIAYFR